MSGRTGERSSGRSGGRGGRGRSSNRGGRGGGRDGASSFSSPSNNKPKLSKQDRKAGKRAKQLEAMDKKAKEEDNYFRKCQQEANRQRSNTNKEDGAKTQAELFSKQGSHGINFNKYDEIKVEVKLPPGSTSGKVSALQSFDELKLPPQLSTNVGLMNYKLPTPIQRNAVPLCMAGEDLMCCAQTGSGKTCAFLLPVCAALASGISPTNEATQDELQPARPSCVVLAPTRELASQIELEAQKLTFHIPNVSPVVVYGGAPSRPQLRDLAFACSKTALIVVATPGRLTDFVDRGIISLSHVQFLVLDEADRMLDMGFMVSQALFFQLYLATFKM